MRLSVLRNLRANLVIVLYIPFLITVFLEIDLPKKDGTLVGVNDLLQLDFMILDFFFRF